MYEKKAARLLVELVVYLAYDDTQPDIDCLWSDQHGKKVMPLSLKALFRELHICLSISIAVINPENDRSRRVLEK